MNSYELKCKAHDGLDLFGQGWEPEQRAPKAVVCLVHGLGEHTGRYDHVGGFFTKAGYAMLGFDLRGHGRSGGQRGHASSIEDYLKDIDLLLAQARLRYPGLPLFLYGHSLGSVLTLHYCLQRKPDLKGVIVTGAALHNSLELQKVKVALVRALGTIAPRLSLPNDLDVNMLSHDPSVVQAYLNDPLVHDRVTTSFGKLLLPVLRWTLEHAAEFPLPLLMMHGKQDQIALPSSSIEFAAPLKEKCTLMLWDGMYHEVHNEPQKNEVLDAMVIWMDARLTQ